MAGSATAETLRIAFWNADLARRGPGLLARDLIRAKEPDVQTAIKTVAELDADILVLSGFDFDAGGLALTALNDHLPRPYPTLLPLRPNTGLPTGFDLDGNGRSDEARDAQGFGRFPGQGGMAVLSRFPIDHGQSRDFSPLLWRDLPGADLPPLPEGAADVLRLSTTGHHDTALVLPDGRVLHLLTWHATTPAFDGPEDRNGKRNADETRFWTLLLDAALPFPPPTGSFVVIGQANADPEKGDGNANPIKALIADPRLQSPLSGDTSDYGGTIGSLRTAYILPSAALKVTDSGVESASSERRHRPIWVELDY